MIFLTNTEILVRKKGYNELLIEIMRGLKENGYVEIQGV